jgi:hypothetical protein
MEVGDLLFLGALVLLSGGFSALVLFSGGAASGRGQLDMSKSIVSVVGGWASCNEHTTTRVSTDILGAAPRWYRRVRRFHCARWAARFHCGQLGAVNLQADEPALEKQARVPNYKV